MLRYLFAIVVVSASPAVAAPLPVYILAGQSNAVGVVGPVPASVNEVQDNPFHFWLHTSAGDQSGYLSLQPLGYPTVQFGPELSFGQRVAGAVTKVAQNGSDIAAWEPARNYLWRILVNEVDASLAAYEADGHQPYVAGFLWVQGEADAANEAKATNYATKLTSFIAAVKTQWPEVPFVFNQLHAGVTVYPFVNEVRQSQATVAALPGVRMLNVDDLQLSNDKLHFAPETTVELGKRFAAIFQPGDFNIDGRVDGSDFLVWQRRGGDIQAWRDQMGGDPLAGVPEPSSLALLLAGLLLVSRQPQRLAIA